MFNNQSTSRCIRLYSKGDKEFRLLIRMPAIVSRIFEIEALSEIEQEKKSYEDTRSAELDQALRKSKVSTTNWRGLEQGSYVIFIIIFLYF